MEKWARLKYQPNLPLGENGLKVTANKEHIGLTRKAASEGIVLLKNNESTLPLKAKQNVALFGKATIDYVQGGGGAGEVNSAYTTNLYEGLKQKGDKVNIFDPLVNFYKQNVESQFASGAIPGMTKEPAIPEDLLEGAKQFTDTAVISICRFSGEGWDRQTLKTQKKEGLWDNIDTPMLLSQALFEDGDFYLTQDEKNMINAVKVNFAKVIVIINSGGITDTSWFYSDDSIQSALFAWVAGMEGGLALADILTGDTNPSGKLADTFAASQKDYPCHETFHESEEFVNYSEDIYVGYRYFETFEEKNKCVNYSFGFGLSYTTFDIKHTCFCADKDNITIKASVKNTGSCTGKEVVQLYVNAPQKLLKKPTKELIAFEKTKLLCPGEMQDVTLEININDLAKFDDTGKIAKSAYVLEKGEYTFYLGNSVKNAAALTDAFTVSENVVTQQLSAKLTPTHLTSRLLSDNTYEQLETQNENPLATNNILEPMTIKQMECMTPVQREVESRLFVSPFEDGVITLLDVAQNKADLKSFIAQLSNEDLANLLGGQPNTGVGITFGIGNIPNYGVPTTVTADGPAGIRIDPKTGIATTSWPCSTLLACTWNKQLLNDIGVAAAKELKENNMAIWLAPAINIHRSLLCGRNFEYFSEDPVLTGQLAAEMVKGIQSINMAACVKHFAFNNKETNRKYSDSRISERAAREIYLKAFEIIVKTAQPWVIMSSYNLVNGVRCAESKELLSDILRDEWGFDGVVVSDWWAYSEHYLEIKAGNDVKMGLGYPKRVLKALKSGAITRKELEISAKRVLKLIMKFD